MSERKGTKALELWCKRLVKDCPNVHIENMTTSWRNGIAFCALVHHFRPDLIDICSLKPDNIYYNNQLAFNIAEKQLGIPALLDPEDMVENDIPDRLSILTYLSQFYQRLGHTVSPKYTAENDLKENVSGSPVHSTGNISKNFVKSDLDKCSVCGQSVYLAQRLIISHKLYHRRCFRCSECSVQLSPGNYSEIKESPTLCCDGCKSASTTKYSNNNNVQIGMLAFSDTSQTNDISQENIDIKPTGKPNTRPLSFLDKISLFEKKSLDDSCNTFNKLSLQDTDLKNSQKSLDDSYNSFNKLYLQDTDLKNSQIINNSQTKVTEELCYLPSNTSIPTIVNESKSSIINQNQSENSTVSSSIDSKGQEDRISCHEDISADLYKTNINKHNFLQTQLSSNVLDVKLNEDVDIIKNNSIENNDSKRANKINTDVCDSNVEERNINITDDVRIAENNGAMDTINNTKLNEQNSKIDNADNSKDTVMIPPRLKKGKKGKISKVLKTKDYPEFLNPFSDDESEDNDNTTASKIESTNPFGSDEDDELTPVITAPSPPTKRLISLNPFWSDGEEPSTDEEHQEDRTTMYTKSSITTSTPNLQMSTPKRKKARAPPPPIISVSETPDLTNNSCSMEDLASLTSISSYNSTFNSDNRAIGKLTPISRKKKSAPTPPDSISTTSSRDVHEASNSSIHNEIGGSRRPKGPAPGLPLPERREVKLQMSPQQLQVQLDLLETQQLGLERQGVLIEQMIRDRCEGDEGTSISVSQDEVEDLVIQLCELVNEKNDLFRKHTELMYIRRQQRLEQEQADIEHEIRILQSRPAVNRIDADKVREEQLVSRLVEIVRMRDELVQQLEAERRRERREDRAIAASIAHRRAQRNSDSNTSSMKSCDDIPTPKKNKMKDKVKKQLKKAKHTLLIKKKEDKDDRNKDKSTEKVNKSK